MASSDQPTKEARLARYAISAIFLVFGLLLGTWLPYIPEVKLQIGCSESAIGQALLCSGLGAVVSMQTVGSLIHRFGSRNVSVVSAAGACLLVPSLLLHHTLVGLCINLFAVGLCYGALDAGMNSHAIQIQSLFKASILAAIHGWFSLGGIIGGAGAVLATRVGISPFVHIVVTAALLVALTVYSRKFLLSSHLDRDTEGPKFAFPRGKLLILGMLCASGFVIEGGILDWCAIYVREDLKADPVYAGVATALCSGGMALGRFLGDPVLHRFGNRNTIRYGGLVSLIGVAGAIATPSVWLSVLCFGIACLGLSNVVPAVFKEAGHVPGYPSGVSIATVTTCGYGGFLLAPPAIGIVADRFSLAFGLGLLMILGLILVLGATGVSRERTDAG